MFAFDRLPRTVDCGSRLHIDTLRGIACLMLVFFHVVGLPDSGLRLSEGWLRDINDFLVYVRMPLFTFLSGYVYAIRPVGQKVWPFMRGKVRRLLIPLLVVGTGFALLQTLTPGTNSGVDQWYLLHIDPYAHYWFLEALFWIFIAVVVLEKLGLLGTPRRAMAVFFVASVLYLLVFGLWQFSVSGALYLLPFFIAGLSCRRFNVAEAMPISALVGLLALSGGTFWLENTGLISAVRSPTGLVLGVTSCIALLRAPLAWRPLAIIGSYSYGIYLFHVFFTGAARLALSATGIGDILLLLLVGMTLGVAGPIVVEKVASRYPLTATTLLGKRWKGNTSRTLNADQVLLRGSAGSPETRPHP